jgi:hypothetical protein
MTNANENMCTETVNQGIEAEAQTEVEEAMAGLAPTALKEALDQLSPLLLAIPADDVRTLRVNPTYAVAICLRVAAALEQDRELFAQHFSPEKFDLADYDDLAGRGLALWQANILLQRAKGTITASTVVYEQCKALRLKLLEAAEYLYSDHPELGSVVADIRSGHGKLNITDDLAALVNLFQDQWDDAEPNCRITEDDLEAATELCMQMILASTIQTFSEVVHDARDLRNRAAEYLRRGVDDIRAAAGFVFRNDPEALESYPGLFSGRKRRGGMQAEEPEAADLVADELEAAAPDAPTAEPTAHTSVN